MVPMVDLRAAWAEIADEAESMVLYRLRSGDYLGAESVAAFESEFAAYVGGGVHAVACSSGTDAVELMVRACTDPSAEVAVPRETFVATLAAVERSGRCVSPERLHPHAPILADVAIATWLYGSTDCADYIRRVCTERGVMLLEDASQAHGNKRAGTIGDAAAWSLYPSKNLGAAGQAGVVTFKDSVAAAKARRIREHGYDRATDRHWGRGFNMRMDGLQADILRVQLKHLDRRVARKREIAKRYIAEIPRRNVLTLPEWEPDHAWHQFVVRHNDRDAFAARLKERGVSTAVHYRTTADGREDDWSRSVLSLPCHAQMSDSQVAQVIDAVRVSV
jgi:dTDP-4-amino-4,6-dideoxygalactose transaminase